MANNETLPKGLHRFYRNETFAILACGFIAALTYEAGKSDCEAANAFREFMQLDEDVCPTRSLVQKYYRLRKDLIDAIKSDRHLVDLRAEEFADDIASRVVELLKNK